jgi:hypothetical protein
MRPLLAIAAFMLVALAACKKTNTKSTDTAPMAYTINLAREINIPSNGGGYLSFSVLRAWGIREAVSFSLRGVPDKVTADFSATSGTPDFSSILNFKSANATQGTYPLTLMSTTAAGTKKTFDFKLVIGEPADCADLMTEYYGGTQNCDLGSGPFSVTMTVKKDSSAFNVLVMDGLFSGKAILDCGLGTMTFPENITTTPGNKPGTTIVNKTTGSGTFSTQPRKMNFTIYTVQTRDDGIPGFDRACTYSFSK